MEDLSAYNEIIIWGAAFPPNEMGEYATNNGWALEKLHDLLLREDVWERVAFIVDSNKSLQGKARLGKIVKAPSEIVGYPNALVVINTISILAIQKAMVEMGAKNDCAVIPYYFYHGTLGHPYINEVAKNDIEEHGKEIRELYDQEDTLTQKYLDIIFDMRKKGRDELYRLNYYAGTGESCQYFCDSHLAPQGDVTFIDVGAYDGDSIEAVRRFYGARFKKCYAFEPSEKARERLVDYLKTQDLDLMTSVYPYALGNKDDKIRFSDSGGMSGEVSEAGEVVLEQRIFDNLSGIDVVGNSMVKMDIEGAELGALKGMEVFIKMHQPYLAICIYHREQDLYAIASYLRKLIPSYHLYIRGGWHLECWAVPHKHFEVKREKNA